MVEFEARVVIMLFGYGWVLECLLFNKYSEFVIKDSFWIWFKKEALI